MPESVPPSLVELQRLYDRGLFLTAWETVSAREPLERLAEPELRIFAGRLLRFLGAGRRGERLILRTWKAYPDRDDCRRHALWIIAERRGPWEALQRLEAWQPKADAGSAVDWLCLRGELLSRLRDFSRAEAALTEARQLDPQEPWAHVCWAFHCERADRNPEALAAVEQALAINPHYPHARSFAAHLHQLLGQDDAAVALLERAGREAQSGHAAAQLAMLFDELRRPDDLERTLDLHERFTPLAEPNLREWRAGLRAQVAYHRGDRAAAAEWAKQAGSHRFFQSFAQRLTSPAPEWKRVELPVGFVRQHHLTCVPATLTTLARYWQQPVEHLEVAEAICYDGTPSHSERRWAEQGAWVAREFRVTLPAARALLDRGVPFAFTTVYPGDAHEQAIVGYDDFRETLLIRDPTWRNRTELLTDKGLEAYAASGPRGLALVPADRASLLDGIELPDAELYDEHHRLLLALDRHDRPAAAVALERLSALAPEHRLTLQARRAVAGYDSNAAAHLAALESLLVHFPQDANFQLSRFALLRELESRAERLAKLQAAARAKEADPLLWQELAGELAQDAREHDTARRWLKRAARVRPFDGFNHFTRAQLAWERGEHDTALALYRVAACLDDKREAPAQAYFRAARWRGRATEALAWLTERFEREGRRSGLPGRTLYWAHAELDQTTAAFAILERALGMRPADVPLRLYAVEEYARWGDLRRAGEHLQAADGPAAPAAWARAAASLAARRGDTAEQICQWRAVLAAEPLNFDAHRQLAQLLTESENRDAALAHLKAATERFPHHLPLRQLFIEWAREAGAEVWEPAIRELLAAEPQNAWALRELAGVLTQQRRFAEAQAALESAAALEPNVSGQFNICGDLFAAQGDNARAREQFRLGLAQSVDNVWAMRALLENCTTREQRLEAIAFVQQELIRQTTVGDGLFEFAGLARAHLAPVELERLLRQAYEARPDLWQTWSALVQQLNAQGLHDAALELVRAANERFPLLPRLWVDRALVHRARLEHDAELEALNKVRELNPSWGWAMRELAIACFNAGKPQAAQAVLEEAVRRSPADGFNHAALADARRKLGDPAGAIAGFREAVLRQPGYDWAWNQLNELAAASGQPKLARELAEELTRRRAGEARSWWLFAHFLDDPAERPRRLEVLAHALTLNPRFLAVHSLIARTHAAAGRWEEAFLACRPAVFGETRPTELVAAEASLRASRGNLEAAIKLLEQALAADPGYEPGWRELAHWHHLREDFDAAIKATEQLARLTPLDPVPLGYLGDLKLRRQDRDGAFTAFHRAFELDAGYTFAGCHLFDLQLERDDFSGALETAHRLRPHLPGPATLELELGIAIAANRPAEFAAVLRQLCAAPTDNPEAFARALGRIRKANWTKRAEPVVREALRQPPLNPSASAFWVELAADRSLAGLLPVLDSLGFADEPGLRAWERWLDAVGDRFASAAHREDLLRWCRSHGFRRALRHHRAEFRSHTRLWGKVGYVLICARRWRELVAWLADWQTRPDVSPWMINNLAVGLAHSRRDAEFWTVVAQVTASNHRDEFTVRFELWHALSALADDRPEPAAALAAQLHPERLSDYDRNLFEALQIWLRFSPGTRGEPLTQQGRARLARFASQHRAEPVLRTLFGRLMRQTARRSSWPWTRVWTWTNGYPDWIPMLLGVAVVNLVLQLNPGIGWESRVGLLVMSAVVLLIWRLRR